MDAGKKFMEVQNIMLQEYGVDVGNERFDFSIGQGKTYADTICEYEEIEHDVDVLRVVIDTFTSRDLTSMQMYGLEWIWCRY